MHLIAICNERNSSWVLMKESYVVLRNVDLMKCEVISGCCIVALNFFTTGAAKSGSFLMFFA